MIITVTPNPAIDKIYGIDRLKVGEVSQDAFLTRAMWSDTSAGGKGVNVSIFLARMGMESVAMGFVGGHTGHVIVSDLRDEGVTTNFVWVREETRTNVTILEQGREYIPILIDEAGPTVSSDEINRFLRRYKRIIQQARWVVLGGSLPPGVPADFYRQLAELAKEAGARVVVSAGGTALTHALSACPYMVKPDIRERLSLEGADLSTREGIITAGKGMVACGVEMIVVSHEFTGDIVITRDAIWEIKARVSAMAFKNLVGADDAMVGGLLYKLDQEAGLEEALRFGMAAAIRSAESQKKICQDVSKIETEMTHISLQRV